MMKTDLCSQQVAGWPTATLESVSTRITSGGTPKRLTPGYYTDESGTPWVKTQELQDRTLHDTEEHITDLALRESSAKKLPRGTLLMAMYAAPTAGRMAILGREMACNQAACAFVFDPLKADVRFMFYQLLHARPDLHRLANGAAQQNLSARVLRELEVLLPPIDEQRRIAGVLGALDDLIEVNRRLMFDLVALGDTAFDSWARGVEGRVPLGEVMHKVADGVDSGSISSADVYLGLEHFGMDASGLIGRGRTDGLASNKIKFRSGDVLYGKLRPYFRKVARPGFSGVCTTEAWVLRGDGAATQEYIHWIARRPDFTQRAMAGSEGTKMPRANWSHVTSMRVPDPSAPGLVPVSDDVYRLWEAASALDRENAELAITRDELLPLLMSGRVRVGGVAA